MTTTITTVTGLIPMFIGGSESSNFQTPIATSVIFGLIFATIISLILVPVMYELFEGRRERKMREKMQKMNEEALTESSM
nr:efflux RND transporter permease subunit [Caldalkalibacillus mannanilyticus]